jgi:peptide/nickel transport system substrate-binding protein
MSSEQEKGHPVHGFLVRALAASIAVLVVATAGCGGGSSSGSPASGEGAASTGATGGTGRPVAAAPSNAKKGGTLTVLSAGDVDSIDPGIAYYSVSYQVLQPTLAPLYDYAPGDPTTQVPILASALPQISADGRTITVKLRKGFRFSPPVNREVTSKDVKYAMERAFTKNVRNGYVSAYFGDVVGVKAFQDGKAKEISGIETPDDSTLVFKLSSGGGVVAGALVLPITSPVPPEYAKRYDAASPSTYGMHQVSAGPYMIKQYKATRSVTLVRNPNWDGQAIGDPRPAYLDQIDVDEGNDNDTVASKRILSGESMVSGDFTPPPAVLKDVVRGPQKDQIQLSPGTDVRYVAMNTTIKPFDNVNVRKAVVAAYDRRATLLARGGPLVGDLATHYLYPGVPGFEDAGGMKGPGYDFLASPTGDMQLAASYLKKAGYANGRYSGPPILMVGAHDGVRAAEAQVAQQQFEKLGFKVTLRLLSNETMFTKFCDVTKAQVAVCPNVGWYGDFADSQTILDPTFNGKNILPDGNSNWSQLDDPNVNAAMAKAKKLSDPAERAKAWANVDRMISALAPAIPTVWDKRPTIESANVAGVNALWNLGYYDLAYTSLK